MVDRLQPSMILINGGINDVAAGTVTQAQFLANWKTMLDYAVAKDAIPIVLLMGPWTGGTTAQMRTRDAWNTALTSMAGTYTQAVVVDANTVLSQFRAGGDAGNLWDPIAGMLGSDGLHPTATGYTAFANAIIAALEANFSAFVPSIAGTTRIASPGQVIYRPFDGGGLAVNSVKRAERFILWGNGGSGTVNVTSNQGGNETYPWSGVTYEGHAIEQGFLNMRGETQQVTVNYDDTEHHSFQESRMEYTRIS
jgi:hypothetical protein